MSGKGVPNDQINFIFDYLKSNNIQEISTEQLALELAGKYGFSVEINTAKEPLQDYEMVDRTGEGDFEPQEFIPDTELVEEEDEDGNIIGVKEVLSEKGKKQIEDRENKRKNTQHYSSLSARDFNNESKYKNNPDWEYQELAIQTPLIINNNPKHTGDFSNNVSNMIGWIRVWYNKKTGAVEIQEIQSALFQEGRYKKELINAKYEGIEYVTDKDLIKTLDNKVNPMYSSKDSQIDPLFINNTAYSFNDKGWYSKKYSNIVSENQFLQLLNKDNNWVTFFIKSIIQDSAKKGYEKVLFPKGETAAKIEGHETVAQRLNELDIAINNPDKYKSYSQEEGGFVWRITGNIGGDYIESYSEQDFIETLNKEKQELKSQGIEKLKPIEAFYEIKVGNILEKLFGKDNVKTITDEYGNQWREITINQARDLANILLQRDEANRIIGQANIKAMTVLVDAINKKADTLPHEYAHHYIAWFRNTPIVQEAIKKWGSE